MRDVEVISMLKGSMSLINLGIPSLPRHLKRLGGAQLPNGDLLISGGAMSKTSGWNDEYFHYKEGSNQWEKVGTMKRARLGHSSVLIDGNLLTAGGCDWLDSSAKLLSNHEEFSINGGEKERTNMPIALTHHAAAVFGKHTILISGGLDAKVDETFS